MLLIIFNQYAAMGKADHCNECLILQLSLFYLIELNPFNRKIDLFKKLTH